MLDYSKLVDYYLVDNLKNVRLFEASRLLVEVGRLFEKVGIN